MTPSRTWTTSHPRGVAREIVEDLTAALVEFEAVAAALEAAAVPAQSVEP
ncbi:MAG: hypothetical protein ACR2K2_02420 [Mycobacteriales bacterium]